MAICNHCKGDQVLEVRVLPDQKIYVDCLCREGNIECLIRSAFAEGYTRATDDLSWEVKIAEEIEDE